METIVEMNRIDQVFQNKNRLLNIYYTAGYPQLEDTIRIAKVLEKSGADLIELGVPYSDPIADGPTIQDSSTQALKNGMSINKLFEQLVNLRKEVSIPVLLMGYFNPVYQYGFERFCAKCREVGIDGLIIPDLPMYEYSETYQPILEKHGLYNIFLITPQTSEERIRDLSKLSKGFLYMVSSASITGAKTDISDSQVQYFKKVQALKLGIPKMIGFGISNAETFNTACDYAEGAIIGSAFIKQLALDASDQAIMDFIKRIKNSK